MNGLSDILVVGEWSNGSLSVTTGELIAAGRQLSNDCSLPVAVLGSSSTNLIARGYLYGAISFFTKLCKVFVRALSP